MEYEFGGCPACGSSAHVVIADDAALKSQQEDLWRFQLKRRSATVPPEQLYDRAFFTQAPPLQVVQCAECGTVYRNPRERADRLVEAYAEEESDERVLTQLFNAQCASYQTQARLLSDVAGRTGTGLELGSYVGAFLSAARAKGWVFEGADINASASAFAQKQGFTVWPGGLEAAPANRRYDAIAIWNCFDQLPNPRSVLAEASNRLDAGGIVAIRVPNGELYGRLAHSTGLGRAVLAHNNLLGFPYRQGFTPTSLPRLLQAAGFDVVRVRSDVLVPTSDRWTKWWARLEQRAVKRVLKMLAMPLWFEVYAKKA